MEKFAFSVSFRTQNFLLSLIRQLETQKKPLNSDSDRWEARRNVITSLNNLQKEFKNPTAEQCGNTTENYTEEWGRKRKSDLIYDLDLLITALSDSSTNMNSQPDEFKILAQTIPYCIPRGNRPEFRQELEHQLSAFKDFIRQDIDEPHTPVSKRALCPSILGEIAAVSLSSNKTVSFTDDGGKIKKSLFSDGKLHIPIHRRAINESYRAGLPRKKIESLTDIIKYFLLSKGIKVTESTPLLNMEDTERPATITFELESVDHAQLNNALIELARTVKRISARQKIWKSEDSESESEKYGIKNTEGGEEATKKVLEERRRHGYRQHNRNHPR